MFYKINNNNNNETERTNDAALQENGQYNY